MLAAQSCLCNPVDYSLPGSSVHGVLQAWILEQAAVPSSRGSFWSKNWTCVSYISCIVGRFFTVWATREAQIILTDVSKIALNFAPQPTKPKILNINSSYYPHFTDEKTEA